MERVNLEKVYSIFSEFSVWEEKAKIFVGALRESNPRPLPPKGRIIPLDQGPI